VIIGLTGTIGAGKGTVVEYLLSHHDFTHYSVRDILNTELNKLNKELSRENMIWISNKLRQKNGAGYFMETLLKQAKEKGGNAIIESIRTLGEVESMRSEAADFILFAVTADPKIRYERIVRRNSSTDHVTFEKFMEDESTESQHGEKWQQNLPGCIALADYTFMNNGSIEDFYAQVEGVVKKIS
jgi:dephospho-CoA kinase